MSVNYCHFNYFVLESIWSPRDWVLFGDKTLSPAVEDF